jgi:hypothetical protein
MKFKAIDTPFYREFAPACSRCGVRSIPAQIRLQLTIHGDRIKRWKTAVLASTQDQPGQVGVTDEDILKSCGVRFDPEAHIPLVEYG